MDRANHLHKHAARRSDRLTFDEQEVIAEQLGYRAGVRHPEATDEQIEGSMVEAFMSDYYRHARAVNRAREEILGRATPHIGHRPPREVDLGNRLGSFDGQVTVADAQELSTDPALALRLYATAVSKDMRVLPFARAAIARAVAEPGFAEALRANQEAATLFVGLLCTAKATQFKNGSILSELHDVGLLTAMIPEFVPVVGRVHHDIYQCTRSTFTRSPRSIACARSCAEICPRVPARLPSRRGDHAARAALPGDAAPRRGQGRSAARITPAAAPRWPATFWPASA